MYRVTKKLTRSKGEVAFSCLYGQNFQWPSIICLANRDKTPIALGSSLLSSHGLQKEWPDPSLRSIQACAKKCPLVWISRLSCCLTNWPDHAQPICQFRKIQAELTQLSCFFPLNPVLPPFLMIFPLTPLRCETEKTLSECPTAAIS